jgi:predicted Zn-dependent protease
MTNFETAARLLVLIPVLSAGCAVNPQVDKQFGAQMAEQIAEQMPLLQDDKVAPFIEQLGDNLVDQLGDQPFDYEFFVIDLDEPNAFAVLGGFIYFSRGLLVLANSEDELAGVMGHEIIHVDKRHSIRGAQRGIIPGLLKLPGRAVGLVHDGLGDALQSPFVAMTARYGRGQETEADLLGIELSAKDGYDPAKLAKLLETVSSVDTYLTGEEESFSYFDSHPYTPDRASDIRAKAERLQPSDKPPIKKDDAAFLRMFEGMVIGDDPAQGVFVEQSFFHTGFDIALDFPTGWVTLNTPGYVAATEPNKEAQLVLRVEGPAGEPAIPAGKLKEELERVANIEPTVEQPFTTTAGHKGHYLALQDRNENESMTLHFVWLSIRDTMYEFIGMGHDHHQEIMKNSVLSMRQIKPEERRKLFKVVFTLATAQAGETLKTLSARTKNALSLEYTSVINNRAVDEKLEAGVLIKIGAKKPI